MEYIELKSDNLTEASCLVWTVFSEFVAPGYLPEGVETFRKFIQPEELKKSLKSETFFMLGCYDGEKLVGVAAMRDLSHVSLLFVDKEYHGRGIAKRLFSEAIKQCIQKYPKVSKITVNSSPYAVEIYKRLGFKETGEQTTHNGITYLPMKMLFTIDALVQEMQIGDYSEIYELWSNTPGMGLSDADTYKNIHKFLLRNKGLSYVCRHKDKIIGTILCGHDGRRGYIYHVTVAEEYRGRGIGLLLVEKSLEKLKEEGIHKCHLFVFRDNEIGNAFWRATGWIKREDIFVYSKGATEK